MFYVLSPSVYLKVGKSKGGAFINMVMNFGIFQKMREISSRLASQEGSAPWVYLVTY